MRLAMAGVAAAAVLGLGLAGCMGTGKGTNIRGQSAFDDDVDYVKMAIITRDAQMRGYNIVWIHPPQKDKGKALHDSSNKD
jgi:hypothetical protein